MIPYFFLSDFGNTYGRSTIVKFKSDVLPYLIFLHSETFTYPK